MNKKNKKVLLINPPLSDFETIYSSGPVLLGQLRANNIDSDIIDMNIEFFKEITSPKYLKYTKELLKKIYDNISILNDGVNSKYYLSEEQLKEIKDKIDKYLFKNEKNIDFFINKSTSFFDEFLKICTSDLYLDSKEYQEKYNAIFYYLVSFAFLPFYPEKVYMRLLSKDVVFATKNKLYKYVYEDIVEKISNRKRNIYISFFEKIVKKLKLNQYDVIAITIPFEQNTYPALTLSKVLKDNTKAKVVIGGIIPTTTIQGFLNHPGMFDNMFDNILIGEGEKSIVDYVRYIEGKVPISEVSGLVYKENGTIKENKIIPIENINDIHPPCFDGIDFKNYISKYIPLEFSKGCYWHKCTFCYNNLWKKYYIKNHIDAVNIIQNLQNKYKINRFSILDDALNINFIEKFADEIIKRKLNIKYNCFLRMEENLTYQILEKIKKSGNSGIFFGIESASDRILKLMNKGINLDTAKRILKDCKKIGLCTTVGFMYGFPTETEEDIMKTINFIKENSDLMTFASNFIFHITKSSAMLTEENISKFQLKNVVQPEEFSDDISFSAPGISRNEICKILDREGLIYSYHTKWL